jgi:hypothetical protein
MKISNHYDSPSQFTVGNVYWYPKKGAVIISDGHYMGIFGISNHWTFRKINKNGTLGKEFSAYGQPLKQIKHKKIIKFN